MIKEHLGFIIVALVALMLWANSGPPAQDERFVRACSAAGGVFYANADPQYSLCDTRDAR